MVFNFPVYRRQVAKAFFRNPAISTIENEPMLFSASFEFAAANGGPLTRNALNTLYDRIMYAPGIPENYHVVIDTRSHMLQPGMYPCIPGWHCDGVPRAEEGSQPDLNKIDPNIRHYVVIVSNRPDVCRTEFMDEDLQLKIDPDRVWQSTHESIECEMAEFDLRTMHVEEGFMCEFSQTDLHRCKPAVKPGWRWFFRLSVHHSPPQNKIRHQTQVYVPNEGHGW